MVGFKETEIMYREKIVNQALDAFDLEAILDYNDIPEQAVLDSLIDNDYLSLDDLMEQLDDEGLLETDEEVDD